MASFFSMCGRCALPPSWSWISFDTTVFFLYGGCAAVLWTRAFNFMFWFVMSISSSICSYKYIVYNFVCILCDVVDIYSTGEKNKPATVQRSIWVILGLWGNNTLQSPTELWKKNISIYRRRLSMIENLRTFFFHNYCFHIFSMILSVAVCPSIRNLNAF
jgi:hypothetical protein